MTPAMRCLRSFLCAALATLLVGAMTSAQALVSPTNGGTTNWPPPAYSPEAGLLFVIDHEDYTMYYLTDPDPRGAMGLGGKTEVGVGSVGRYLAAIDYKTGKVVWRHKYPAAAEGREAAAQAC